MFNRDCQGLIDLPRKILYRSLISRLYSIGYSDLAGFDDRREKSWRICELHFNEACFSKATKNSNKSLKPGRFVDSASLQPVACAISVLQSRCVIYDCNDSGRNFKSSSLANIALARSVNYDRKVRFKLKLALIMIVKHL